jgi:hypothetical protein
LVIALGGACTNQRPDAPVDIDTAVNGCVQGGQQCYFLPVPEASVELADSGGRVLASGTTDDSGRVTLSAPKLLAGGKVTVRSPLFEGGLVEASLEQVGEGGSSVTVRGELAAGARGQ